MAKAVLFLIALFLCPLPLPSQEKKGPDWPSSWSPELIKRVKNFIEERVSNTDLGWRRKQCADLNEVKELLDKEKDSYLRRLSDSALDDLNLMSFACSLTLLADLRDRPDDGSQANRISLTFSAIQTHDMVEGAASLRLRERELLLGKDYDGLVDRHNELVEKYNGLVVRYNQLQALAETERMNNAILQQIHQHLRAVPPPKPLDCRMTTVDYGGGFQRSRITCY